MKFCVIGLGRFGYHLAVCLAEQGTEVLAIDSSEELVNSIRDKVTQAICVRVTDEESLNAVGVADMDTVVVATGEDFAQTVLITMLLKQRLNVPHVIARAINEIHEEILTLIGADKIILPERDMGVRLADKLSLPLVDLIPVNDNFAITQLKAPASFAGKTIADLKLVKSHNVSCIAVKKGGDLVLVTQEYIVLEKDILVFAGDRKHLASLIHVQ